MRNWLRELRMNKGYTMKDMGEKLGISESYYCAIENGDRQKKMDMLIASWARLYKSATMSSINPFTFSI